MRLESAIVDVGLEIDCRSRLHSDSIRAFPRSDSWSASLRMPSEMLPSVLAITNSVSDIDEPPLEDSCIHPSLLFPKVDLEFGSDPTEFHLSLVE